MAKPIAQSVSVSSVSFADPASVAGSAARSAPPRSFRRKLPAAGALGALIACGLAALPAVSKSPDASSANAARTPQRVFADTPFPSAQRFVTGELERLIAEQNPPAAPLRTLAARRQESAGPTLGDAQADVTQPGPAQPGLARPGASPGLFASLAAHRNQLLGYDGRAFSLADSVLALTDSGVRAGPIDDTLADTLNRIDIPPEVRIQIGDLIADRVQSHANAQQGDRYRIAFDAASGKPRVTALELRVAGRRFGAVWFKPPGAAGGAYYAFDGAPLDAPALTMPVVSTRISSYFGERVHPLSHILQMHTGVDLAAPAGTRVDAAAAGVVSFVGYDALGYGKYVVIDHPDRTSTYYAHLSAFAPGLDVGMRVAQGQRIGSVGATGAATGPHLHFEVRVDDRPVDPLVALANAQNTLSAMQLDAFRRVASEARFRLASGGARPLGFAQVDAPLWAEFATDTSTLRAIFNTHYASS
ncbi:peptidoglycan DD-metalloendopeptidase family protein [Burkholderia sp. MSMB1589WGS]|uniref:peptidoglycan DD-metalloendopeptidase family protein n=1 Tax=Burkholderia sp. MSMB1589WGS TaxID=1636425 RepID=UPI0007B7E947|nr:peptidoglycan DD-metalloendopeptidase family protein [Burkholderia sp. MSMB1589WGS]